MNNLTGQDIIYLAGLLEPATFNIAKKRVNKKTNFIPTLRLIAHSPNLKEYLEKVGFKSIVSSDISWAMTAERYLCLTLNKLVNPYLIQKKEQSNILLELQEFMERGVYPPAAECEKIITALYDKIDAANTAISRRHANGKKQAKKAIKHIYEPQESIFDGI